MRSEQASNPIQEIRGALNKFESALKGIARHFRIPSEVANRVLALSWEDFEACTGGFLDKSNWVEMQTLAREKGAQAISLLTMGPNTRLEIGDEYSVWSGSEWIKFSDLPSDDDLDE